MFFVMAFLLLKLNAGKIQTKWYVGLLINLLLPKTIIK